jgi:hypothetical protein
MPVRVKCRIENGLTDNQRAVYIEDADGKTEEIIVNKSFCIEGSVILDCIGRDGYGDHLVEFPVESSSGAWRCWISKDQIV